jgi:hypothetical protein
MELYNGWMRRYITTHIDGMPVGAPDELWRLVPKHPGTESLRSQLKEEGRGHGDSDVAYYMHGTLILDVLHAAGAIEYTVGRIERGAVAVAEFAEEHQVVAHARTDPVGLVDSVVDEVYIEYANLLTWLRTLRDRMRSNDPHSRATLGLIPALKPDIPLYNEVNSVFDKFRLHPAIKDEHLLANYGLHLHALPRSDTPVAYITRGGETSLPIPDKPTDRVYLTHEFTWNDQRDLVPFAREVLDRVAVFIDGLQSALENGTAHAMAQRAKAG